MPEWISKWEFFWTTHKIFCEKQANILFISREINFLLLILPWMNIGSSLGPVIHMKHTHTHTFYKVKAKKQAQTKHYKKTTNKKKPHTPNLDLLPNRNHKKLNIGNREHSKYLFCFKLSHWCKLAWVVTLFFFIFLNYSENCIQLGAKVQASSLIEG